MEALRRSLIADVRLHLVERVQSLIDRVAGYPWWQVAIELVVIWVFVYLAARFVQGTRAAGALKGVLVVLVLLAILSRVFGQGEAFQRLSVLIDRFLALAAVGLIVIFQPELRRAAIRIGEAPFLRSTPKDVQVIIDEVSGACGYLARQKFGAIIALERQVGLKGLVEGGTVLNADLTARLLQTIFFPGSALHDLAVIVRGRSVYAAGVQLPLADAGDMPDPTLGSRHRAAVGLSRECDALVVIVSEETGAIRIAERGRLSSPMSEETLRGELKSRLGKTLPAARARRAEDALVPTHRRDDPGESVIGMGGLGATGEHEVLAMKEDRR